MFLCTAALKYEKCNTKWKTTTQDSLLRITSICSIAKKAHFLFVFCMHRMETSQIAHSIIKCYEIEMLFYLHGKR